MFHLSQSFTNEQKPFCIRLGSWCILSLTDFHRGTEAIQRTSWAVACFISHRVSQRDRSLSAYVLVRGVFYLSQSFTEGQKPFCEQGEHTNVCKQTTDITERYCWRELKGSVNSVCRRRSVKSKLCAKRVCQICEFCERNTSPVSLAIVLFLTEYTDEQNTQRCTETLSQPISQNLTAIFGSYALWILYAGGLLWVRNCAQKGSVKSVSSVREKNSTKYASNPIGVTSHITPLPAGEGLGEGPPPHGFETVR